MTRDGSTPTITPRRSIGIRCSLGLWVATALHIVAAATTLGAAVWMVSAFKTTVDLKIKQQDSAIADIWSAVHRLEDYVYQRRGN